MNQPPVPPTQPGGRHLPRPGRYEAWGILALLAPHVAMGGWLLVVPDHVAFTASQWIVLAHVVLGVVCIPIAVMWAYRHIIQARPRTRRTALVVTGRWVLAITITIAFGSGITAIWSGQGMPMAQGHAGAGIMLSAALVLHLVLEGHRAAAGTVVGALLVSMSVVVGARAGIRGDQPEPVSPAFEYTVRDSHLYEEAAWCGSCHEQNYQEWSHSTHGRSTDIQQLRDELTQDPELQIVDLEAVGKAAVGTPGTPPAHHVAPVPSQCPLCHAPLTYYSDDRVPILETKGVAKEGVTCSFCHTLRGIRPVPPGTNEAAREFIRGLQRGERSLKDVDMATQINSTPFYVSAPETVRRYIGQGSPNPFVRSVGDYLIRWRPALHRRDYHSPFMDGSQVCQGCHGAATDAPETPDKTYPDWEASDYNSSDPAERVECQDCHMVGQLTGGKVTEPGRTVPWGPIRPQRRSHLFLGGNAAAALRFNDTFTPIKQRDLGRRGLRLTLEEAVLQEGQVRARVTLKNEAVGHFFPAMESLFRFAFIRIAALDATGKVIAESPPANSANDTGTGTVVLYRHVDQQNLRILSDTTIAPHEARTFEAWVQLPPGAPPVSRVEARLGHSFDPEPFIIAEGPLGAPRAAAAPPGDKATLAAR